MKIKLYKSVALCSLLALAGCHDFEELNTNPYAPIYDPTVENDGRPAAGSISMMTAALRNTASWSRHSISAIRIITIRHSISPVFIMLSCCPCRRTLTEIFL